LIIKMRLNVLDWKIVLCFLIVVSMNPGFSRHRPKALIITGSGNVPVPKANYPPWKHEFQNEKVVQMLQNVVDVDTTTDIGMLNDQTLETYDLLISNSLFLTPSTEQLAALERFILNGKSFMTLHCGMLSLLNWEKYEQLMGGIFIGGPSSEPSVFKVYTENMEFWGYEYPFRKSEAHPVSKVVADFITSDELYYFQPSTPDFHVIARAENHPVMWWHPLGKGKVMSLTLGHDLKAKANEGYQRLLVNGVRWLVGIPLIRAIDPKPISTRRSFYEDIAELRAYAPNEKDAVILQIENSTRPDLFTVNTNSNKKIDIKLTGKTGGGKATLSAKNNAGLSRQDLNIRIVKDGEGNIASYLGNSISASSSENQSEMFDAKNLVDEDSTTRWSSAATDTAWVTIDLDKIYSLSRVKLHWEASYATEYEIQTSRSGQNWQAVADVKDGDGQSDHLTFPSVQARFIRILAKKRATGKWGYSLYEIEVFR
jgi:type 1 glutamine amidotransferase